MDFEASSSGVFLVAPRVLAYEGLHTRVCQFMRLQVSLRNELLSAQSARKGTLSRVSAHVGFQISRLLKLLQATLEWAYKKLHLIFGAFDLFNFCFTKPR